MDPAVIAEDFRRYIVTHALRQGAVPLYCSRVPYIFGVKGEMLIDEPAVGCTIANVTIHFNIHAWTNTPPEVRTDAKWLQPRHGAKFTECADWHRYPDGRLCWTRPDCWRKVCNDISRSGLVERAAIVLARDVSFLLRCHLTASKLGIKKWPKKWDAWPHGRL